MPFPARFAGTCAGCGEPFAIGASITWSRRHKGRAYHAECPNGATNGTGSGRASSRPQVIPIESVINPTSDTEDTEHMDRSQIDSTDATRALDALRVALGTNLIPEAPPIDEDAVRRIVRDCVTEFGTLSINVTRNDGETVRIDGAHKAMPALLKIVARRRHTYLYGPAGSGKSTAARQVADALGIEYGYISLNPQTPDSRLQGFIDANGVYRDPVFRRIYANGGVFCIDECDNASGALLTTLNSALENGHAAFPDGMVKRHADFVMIATGNTAGRGANPMHPERRPFDAAFGDRFVYVAWDYDQKLERTIALSFNPDASDWVDWVQALRKWGASNLPRLLVSPRASIVGADLLGAGFSPAEVAAMTVWKGFDPDSVVKAIAANPLPVSQS